MVSHTPSRPSRPTATKVAGSRQPRPPCPRKPSRAKKSTAPSVKATKSKSRRAQIHAPSSPRPRLSPEQLEKLTARMAEAYGWAPKDFQLQAVRAQIEGQDIIVQAPTGSGKTALAAGPHLWEWPDGKQRFTLMVCPLLSLEEEMVKTFDLDFGLKAVALNSKNGACSPLKIQEILAMKYQIILLSPEMLQSRMFTDRILRNSAFMRSMMSMFVDEAHCIVHWGADFRKQYGTLGKLRAFFPRGTPVIAVTATLTARVYRGIYSSLHFAQSEAQNVFVNKGNDRPNVSIVVRPFEHPLNTFVDLDFLIPTTLRSPSDIPMTYLYVDHKASGGEIIDHLISKLLEHPMNAARSNNIHDRPVPSGVVRPFNANHSQAYRNNAMAQFRAGKVRILVCTDAAGMGCNIPDIKRVVQWKLPGSFSQFIQRAGRAARGRGQTGVAILLVEKSAYNIDIVSKPAPSIDSKDAKKKNADGSTTARTTRANTKQVREYAIAHGLARGGSKKDDLVPSGPQPLLNVDSADEGLLTLVQSVICRRKIWAEVFRSTITEGLTVPCCDICDPTLLDATRPRPVPPERKPKNHKRGLPDLSAQAKLRAWRRDLLRRSYQQAQYDASAILDDDFITTLTTIGPLTSELVSELLKEKWIFWEKHGTELTTFLHTFTIVFTPLPQKPRAAKPGSISFVDLLLDTTPKRPRADSSSDASTTKRARLPEPTEERVSPGHYSLTSLTSPSSHLASIPTSYVSVPPRPPTHLSHTTHAHRYATPYMPPPVTPRPAPQLGPPLHSAASPAPSHMHSPAVTHSTSPALHSRRAPQHAAIYNLDLGPPTPTGPPRVTSHPGQGSRPTLSPSVDPPPAFPPNFPMLSMGYGAGTMGTPVRFSSAPNPTSAPYCYHSTPSSFQSTSMNVSFHRTRDYYPTHLANTAGNQFSHRAPHPSISHQPSRTPTCLTPSASTLHSSSYTREPDSDVFSHPNGRIG